MAQIITPRHFCCILLVNGSHRSAKIQGVESWTPPLDERIYTVSFQGGMPTGWGKIVVAIFAKNPPQIYGILTLSLGFQKAGILNHLALQGLGPSVIG